MRRCSTNCMTSQATNGAASVSLSMRPPNGRPPGRQSPMGSIVAMQQTSLAYRSKGLRFATGPQGMAPSFDASFVGVVYATSVCRCRNNPPDG